MTNSQPEDELVPSPSWIARSVGFLEWLLPISVITGVRGALLTGVVCFGYILLGGVLVFVDSSWAPAEFLALESDPFFYLSVTAVSLFIVQATGSLILYQFLTGAEDDRSQFVILMSYIGLGFGAAALRFTLPQSIEYFIELL